MRKPRRTKSQILLQEYRRLQSIFPNYSPRLVRIHAYFNLSYHNLAWSNICDKYNHRKEWNDRHDENGNPI